LRAGARGISSRSAREFDGAALADLICLAQEALERDEYRTIDIVIEEKLTKRWPSSTTGSMLQREVLAEHFEEFVTALKTPAGEEGGIYALSWAGMLFIKWLWIDEAYRRHGHGRKLMASAEEEGGGAAAASRGWIRSSSGAAAHEKSAILRLGR
jgi:GNAT superfamily N-acetyltransferase